LPVVAAAKQPCPFLPQPNSLARCCSSETAVPVVAAAKQPCPFFPQPNSLARFCRSLTALPVAAAKQPCPLQQPNSQNLFEPVIAAACGQILYEQAAAAKLFEPRY
jgi:hypothetical protein